jgi:hypothetical protein
LAVGEGDGAVAFDLACLEPTAEVHDGGVG